MGIFRDYFKSLIIGDVQQDIMRLIYKGYKDTENIIKTQDFQPGPSKNLHSYVRLASIDNSLLALNNKYDGLNATSVLNNTHNFFYTLVTLENIKITVSAVDSPKTQPRDALFRNELASCQYRFDINLDKFEIKELKKISESNVYAIIIHGPAVDDPRLPAFIHILFPNEDCTEYLDRIDLFKEYPDLVESLVREGTETIPDKAEVKLIQEKLL